MHESTALASRAIESSHRQFTHKLMVDWNNDGNFEHPLSDMSSYVTSTKRDQALSSTAPEELMLVEGYAAAELTVEAHGTFRDVALASHFAPYNGRSIFYTEGLQLGVSMVYEIGAWTDEGFQWFRQFTGVIRDVSADRTTGGITLECLDNVERMRTSVDIAPYALWQNFLQEGYKRGGLIDSSSIVDLAARSAGFSMGPRTPWPAFDGEYLWTNDENPYGPVLSVPFHGSVLPEYGLCDGDMSFHLTEAWENNQFAYRSEAYIPGPHGYLALNAVPPERASGWGYKKYWFNEFNDQAGTAKGTWLLGAWIYWTGNNVDGDSIIIDAQVRKNKLQLFVRGSDGGVEARIRQDDGFQPWTNTPLRLGAVGWHYIQAYINIQDARTYNMAVRVDDAISATSSWTTGNARDINDPLSGLVTINNKYAISDAYVTNKYASWGVDHYQYDRTPADTARVSWGRNRFTHTLREDGREAWDLATEVSSAEYGAVFFDEFGRFISWNYRDMTSRQSTPVRTFTVNDLEQLALRNTIDSVRNVWAVTTQTGRSQDGIVYDLGRDGVPFFESNGQYYPATFILPNNSAKVFYLFVDDHTISLNPFSIPYLPEFHPWEQEVPIFGDKSYTGDNYRVQGPNSEQKLQTRNRARLYLTNGFAEPVGFVIVSTGQARFRLGGRLINEDEPVTWSVRDEDSVAEYGERIIELKDNFWLQDRWQTQGMLSDIVSRMGRPIPVSDKVTVPGDPRIQLGDMIQVQDSDGFGEMTWLQVYGIEREMDNDSGLTDTYTIEAVKSSGQGMWDSETYGIWDQSFIWS